MDKLPFKKNIFILARKVIHLNLLAFADPNNIGVFNGNYLIEACKNLSTIYDDAFL